MNAAAPTRQDLPFAGPGRIARASLAAGPAFVTVSAAAQLYLKLPQPIVVEPTSLLTFPLLWFASAVVGAILAFVPNLVGTLVMDRLARAFAPAAAPEAWALAGAASAGIPLWLLHGEPEWVFPFAATGAVCALICRGRADREPLPHGGMRR